MIIISGLAISLMAGVCNNVEQNTQKVSVTNEANASKKKSDSLTIAIGQKQSELDSLLRDQYNTLQNVSSLTQQLNVTQKQLSSLQQETIKSVVGVGNMPIIYAVGNRGLDTGKYNVDFYIINFSNYPVYGINLRLEALYCISDHEKEVSNGRSEIEAGIDPTRDLIKDFDIPVLYPNVNKHFYHTEVKISSFNYIPYLYIISLFWAGKNYSLDSLFLSQSPTTYFLFTSEISFKINGGKEIRKKYSQSKDPYIYHW